MNGSLEQKIFLIKPIICRLKLCQSFNSYTICHLTASTHPANIRQIFTKVHSKMFNAIYYNILAVENTYMDLAVHNQFAKVLNNLYPNWLTYKQPIGVIQYHITGWWTDLMSCENHSVSTCICHHLVDYRQKSRLE